MTSSKIERCGSSLLTFNRKTEFGKKLMLSKWNRKQKSAVKVVANAVYTAKFENRINYEGNRESDLRWWLPMCECEGECTIVQCTIQRVQPDRGHHCGSKCNKRYHSTSLLMDNRWFIYRHCTGWLEYAGLVWPSPEADLLVINGGLKPRVTWG